MQPKSLLVIFKIQDGGDAYEEARQLNARLNAEIAGLRQLVQSSSPQAAMSGEGNSLAVLSVVSLSLVEVVFD